MCFRPSKSDPVGSRKNDAEAVADKWLTKHARYRFKKVSIVPISRKTSKKRGGPKTDEPMTVV